MALGGVKRATSFLVQLAWSKVERTVLKGSLSVLPFLISAVFPRSVEACSGAFVSPTLLFPERKEGLWPGARPLFWEERFTNGRSEVLLFKGPFSGNPEIDTIVKTAPVRVPGVEGGALLILNIEEALEPGQLYSLVVSDPETERLRVVAEPLVGSVGDPSDGTIANFRFFEEFLPEPSTDSCYDRFVRAVHLEVDVVRPLPAGHWIRLRFEDTEGQNFVRGMIPNGRTTISGDFPIPPDRDMLCVTAQIVDAAGREGPERKVCQSDKCVLNTEAGFFPSIHWDDVPEGCNADCTLGDSGYVCGCNAGFRGSGTDCIGSGSSGGAGLDRSPPGGCGCTVQPAVSSRWSFFWGLCFVAMRFGRKTRLRTS